MKFILNTKQKNFSKEFSKVLESKREQSNINKNIVLQIIKQVKKNKDKAVIQYSKKFDNIKLNKKNILISKKEIKQIISTLDVKVKRAIQIAYKRIYSFHKKQLVHSFQYKDAFNNQLGYKYTPLNKVGIYIPGGKASYPSTVLMNAIPAIVAGVKKIIGVVPTPNNEINAGVIYAATICGVKKIFRIGGAQAIAALAYGTETVDQVDKIVGPGNIYVATAKKEVFGQVGIDMIAGPSEITVVAGKENNSYWTAIDLLSQAEHDQLSQCILLTKNKAFAESVLSQIKKIIPKLPRKEIAAKSIKNYGAIIICKNDNEIIDLVNKIAPEHLEIKIKNCEKIEKKIINAGSIFLGDYSPEAIGDYIAGPNHVLPTSGTARFSSGLSVADFYKKTSLIKCSKLGIQKIGQAAIDLANYEGLQAHALSIKTRLNNNN
jgi:histidinol dehydrogenase